MRKLTPEDFWARVSKDGECWEYNGYRARWGYGRLKYGGKQWIAPRLSWTLTFGEIPEKLWVLHKCDNPPCVRPDHLFLGTPNDNVQDMISKGRDSHGDDHWTRKYPEKVKRGAENGAVKHKERMARGDRHGSKLHPEKWLKWKGYFKDKYPDFSKGVNNGRAILNPELVREIRRRWTEGETQTSLGKIYGVKQTTISGICLRKLWPDVE